MRSRELRSALSTFALAIGLLTAACADRPEPVGRLGSDSGALALGFPGTVEVKLDWQMTRELEGLEGSPTVFVHLLDANGDILRTYDHRFPGSWRPGEEESYSVVIHQSALAPPLNDGSYSLTVGLYDSSGNRWPLETAGRELAEFEYEIATVTVGDPSSPMPQFFFSSEWLGVEGGTDLQILGRRWLTGDGVIRLGGLAQPGTLRVMLGVPEGGGPLGAPVLTEGAASQTVSVTTTCGSAALEVSGPGSHTVDLPVAVPESDSDGPGECEVRFSANYYLPAVDSEERRTMALEGLSWTGSSR